MRIRIGWSFIVVFTILRAGPLEAQPLGVPAPGLDVAGWVKGGPVDMTAGRGRTFYVVEFWATWCGPCRQSIPVLTQLQRTYRNRGLVIIGISDEPAATVQRFVNSMGDKMDYAVAIDRAHRTTSAYLTPFNVEGIPHAFLVDPRGAILWHGHPVDLGKVLDEALGQVFNFAGAMPLEQAGEPLTRYFEAVRKSSAARTEADRKRLADQAAQVGRSLMAQAGRDPKKLNTLSWHIMTLEDLKHRDLDLAEQAAEAAFESSQKTAADRMRKDVQDYFRIVLSLPAEIPAEGKPDPETLRTLTRISSATFRAGEPVVLDEFARTILTAPDLKYRDLDLAVRMAKAANTKTRGRDPLVLDTYALALFETGKAPAAVDLVRKAIEVCKDDQLKTRLNQSLQRYRSKAAPTRTR